MKMKFRVLSLAVSVIMGVSIFTGCSGKTPAAAGTTTNDAKTTVEPKKTVTLKMWGGVPAESGPQEVVDNFNKEFADKGLKIEYERFVNDENGNLKLETYLLSGEDVDLFMTYSPDKLEKRATGKMALDLTPLIERDNFKPEEIVGAAALANKIDGKYYSFPTKKDTGGWIVNKDMFDAAGIPLPKAWTLDEFREIAKKLTKGEGQDKVYGFYAGTAQFKDLGVSFARYELGGNYVYKDETAKESNFDNPIILKYLKTITDMMNVDKSAVPHVDDVTQKLTHEGLFIGGKVAISMGSFIVRSIKDKEKYPHKFVTAFVPVPTAEKGGTSVIPGGVSDDLSISAKSKNVDAAWEFIKWYVTKGILPMAKGGRVPAYVKFDSNSISKAFLSGSEELFDIPSYNEFVLKPMPMKPSTISAKAPEILKITQEECEMAYTGKITPEQAVADMKKRADDELKK